MSTTMPDFEMPAVPQALSSATTPQREPAAARHPVGAPPVRAAAGLPALDANDLTAEPDASDDRTTPRPRPAWRHLVVAGLIGALLGAAVPASFQVLERAAAAAEVDSLRALANDYLTAIAEGRAADATAMVPLEAANGETAPDAVLASARPIDDIQTGLVHVDGEIATVAVEYRSFSGLTRIVLDAERADGDWRLTTSLAEPVTVYPGQMGDVPMVAGSPLVDRRSHLYPGGYTIDDVTGPIFVTTGDRFTVDGDPRTPVEVYPMTMLTPDIEALATEMALRSVEACAGTEACQVPSEARLTAAEGVYVQWNNAREGFADLSVPLMANLDAASQWLDVQVRLHYDAEGVPTRWECGRPGEFEGEFAPCPALG